MVEVGYDASRLNLVATSDSMIESGVANGTDITMASPKAIQEIAEGNAIDTDNAKVSPAHYSQYTPQTIQRIRDILGEEGFQAFCLGCTIKYIERYKSKDTPIVNLKKAKKYLGWCINSMEGEELEL